RIRVVGVVTPGGSAGCVDAVDEVATALLAAVPLPLAERLLHGDGREESPEIGAVAEALETALCRPRAEAMEGAERHVLAILDGLVRCGPEALARQVDDPLAIALPDCGGRLGLTRLEAVEPSCDRSGILRRHRRPRAEAGALGLVRADAEN